MMQRPRQYESNKLKHAPKPTNKKFRWIQMDKETKKSISHLLTVFPLNLKEQNSQVIENTGLGNQKEPSKTSRSELQLSKINNKKNITKRFSGRNSRTLQKGLVIETHTEMQK